VSAPRSSRAGFKAAAASVAAVLAMSAGVAFAATGHLPFAGPLQQTGHGPGRDAAGAAGSHSGATSATDDATPQGPPTPALQGLCVAYARGQKATHGHALEARPFRTLVDVAGGVDRVADFCASLPPHGQADPTRPGRPSHSTHAAEPSDGATQPSQVPESHPTSSSHPTRAASPHHPPQKSGPTKPPGEEPSRTPSPRVRH
jgi:hypothetical protein